MGSDALRAYAVLEVDKKLEALCGKLWEVFELMHRKHGGIKISNMSNVKRRLLQGLMEGDLAIYVLLREVQEQIRGLLAEVQALRKESSS